MLPYRSRSGTVLCKRHCTLCQANGLQATLHTSASLHAVSSQCTPRRHRDSMSPPHRTLCRVTLCVHNRLRVSPPATMCLHAELHATTSKQTDNDILSDGQTTPCVTLPPRRRQQPAKQPAVTHAERAQADTMQWLGGPAPEANVPDAQAPPRTLLAAHCCTHCLPHWREHPRRSTSHTVRQACPSKLPSIPSKLLLLLPRS